MEKRGLSTVVTSLILILLVLVAVGIVWVVVKNVISSGAESVFLDKFTVSLKMKNVVPSSNSITMNVKRNPGEGDLVGIKFIFDYGDSSETVENDSITLNELGELPFTFNNLVNSSGVKTISIAPIYRTSSGKKVVGNIVDTYKITASSFASSQNCSSLGGGSCPAGDECYPSGFRVTSDISECCIPTTDCCTPDTPVNACTTKYGSGYECGTAPVGCGLNDVSCDNPGCTPGTEFCETDGTCQPIVTPCTFSDIVWDNPGTVTEPAIVSFTITSTGNCNSESISVDVWEDDNWPAPDTLITGTPISVTFSGNTATGTWTTSWMDDGGGADPEYFLKAVLDSDSSETVEGSQATADEVTVVQATQPCTFSDIVWDNPGTVTEPAIVSFTITSTGDCNSESISVDVWEDDDWPAPDTLITGTPISVTFSGNTATGTWTTSWMDDGGGADPEYFLKAVLDSDSSETVEGSQATADEVTVVQALGTCSQEEGELCTGGDYCPSGHEVPSSESDCCDPGYCEPSTCSVCDDCETWLSGCTYSECNACTGIPGSCLFRGSGVSDEDCVPVSSCPSYVTQCSDYIQQECGADKCGLGGCLWDGSTCATLTGSYVVREIPTSVTAGNQFTVNLNAHSDVPTEHIFAIQENASGLQIISSVPDEFMNTDEPGVLRTYQAGEIFTLPADFTVYYTAIAPSAGTYTLEGFYIFDSQIQVVPLAQGTSCPNEICETTDDPGKTQNEADFENSAYCVADCSGRITIGPTQITVLP